MQRLGQVLLVAVDCDWHSERYSGATIAWLAVSHNKNHHRQTKNGLGLTDLGAPLVDHRHQA